MLEKQLQCKIIAYLKTVPDTWVVKVVAANKRGCPDLLVCHQGRFMAMEVKHLGGRPTPLQWAQLAAIEDAGGVAAVVQSIGDVEAVLGGAL